MTETKTMQRIELAHGYSISRVIRGGWQLSQGHGQVKSDDAAGDMIAFADAGITTFDCADIYTGVEDMIGEFRQRYRMQRGDAALKGIRVHTKFVPDLDMLPRITRSYVEGVIDRSLQRLKMERLDLVQFHWWDYAVPGYLEAAAHLVDLQRAGKIDRIGATNFDTAHMLGLVESGVPLVSMQVQYSLLDAVPPGKWSTAAAQAWRVHSLLRHGRRRVPERPLAGCAGAGAGFENRSLIKYKLIIDDFGGWALFQKLLQTLRAHRRQPRQRHRHSGQRRDAQAAGCRRRHRRRAQPLASGFEPGNFEPGAYR